jgi:hypothetical protein
VFFSGIFHHFSASILRRKASQRTRKDYYSLHYFMPHNWRFTIGCIRRAIAEIHRTDLLAIMLTGENILSIGV